MAVSKALGSREKSETKQITSITKHLLCCLQTQLSSHPSPRGGRLPRLNQDFFLLAASYCSGYLCECQPMSVQNKVTTNHRSFPALCPSCGGSHTQTLTFSHTRIRSFMKKPNETLLRAGTGKRGQSPCPLGSCI